MKLTVINELGGKYGLEWSIGSGIKRTRHGLLSLAHIKTVMKEMGFEDADLIIGNEIKFPGEETTEAPASVDLEDEGEVAAPVSDKSADDVDVPSSPPKTTRRSSKRKSE